MTTTSPPADRHLITLRERMIRELLAPRYGGPQHNTPGGLPLTASPEEARRHRAGQTVDLVLSVLPAELAQHVARAVFALKTPPPAGSQHYRSGWDDGVEAAMDAARDAVLSLLADGAPTPAHRTALEAERDSLGREADRLRKDWVEMRDRAERAEAELCRLAGQEQPPAPDHEHVWVTALDGNDQPARDADGQTWPHCGVCGTRRGIARDMTRPRPLSTPCARPGCGHPLNWHTQELGCTAHLGDCPCQDFEPPAEPPCSVCEHGHDQHRDGHCRLCGILRVNYPDHEYAAAQED